MFYKRIFEVPSVGFVNPLSRMELLRRQIERLSEVFDMGASSASSAGVFPLINLTEDRDNYYIKAELPSVKAEALDIQADGKSLSISGERKIELENDGVKYHRKEREEGKFSRMISLPGEIDVGKIDAQLKDGILKIIAPKSEVAKPRQITVK